METRTLFESSGSKTTGGSTALLTLVVLGVVGSVTLLLVALIAPEKVGSPLLYTAALVGFVAGGAFVFKQNRVEIRIVQEGAGLRLVVRGPTTRVDELLEPGGEHWVSFEPLPRKMGGGLVVRYSVVVSTRQGRKLGFNLRAGRPGTEPPDWPRRAQPLRDGRDVFLCLQIHRLPAALRGKHAA